MRKLKHRRVTAPTAFSVFVTYQAKSPAHWVTVDDLIRKIVRRPSDHSGMELRSHIRDHQWDFSDGKLAYKTAAALRKNKILKVTVQDRVLETTRAIEALRKVCFDEAVQPYSKTGRVLRKVRIDAALIRSLQIGEMALCEYRRSLGWVSSRREKRPRRA